MLCDLDETMQRQGAERLSWLVGACLSEVAAREPSTLPGYGVGKRCAYQRQCRACPEIRQFTAITPTLMKVLRTLVA